MKKSYLWIGLALAAGLLLGYFIFSGPGDAMNATGEHNHTQADADQMWTCSMHPQILQPEPGSCPICGMDLIPADSGADGLAPGQLRLTENALALADVQTIRLGDTESGNRVLTLSGTIEANEKKIATQSAYFDGRIETLSINYEGEPVRKGQRLATLYAPDLVAAQQELLTAARLKETQPQLYQAVRKKLELWKLSGERIRQIEESGEVQEYFPVFSDVSGTVSQIDVAAGDYVRKGEPLFRIADLGTVWVEFDAYENQLAALKTGQELTIRAGALEGREFRAPIQFISPILNSTTRTAVVRATIDNSGGELKPGMFVRAELEVSGEAAGEGLVVPQSAVLWTGERSIVYVKPDASRPVFEMREVHLGTALPGGYRVLDGLQPGEVVVVNGTFTLDAAAQLQGKKSMMNPESEPMGKMHDHGDMGSEDGMAANVSSGTGQPGPKLPQADQAVFREVLSAYLELKDALVASDNDKAARAAAHAAGLLKSAGEGLSGLRGDFRELGAATDVDGKRERFIGLSERMVALASGVSDLPGTLFVQFCPMADENRGAYWLSKQESIRNPYFGDAMLTCGEVRDTL